MEGHTSAITSLKIYWRNMVSLTKLLHPTIRRLVAKLRFLIEHSNPFWKKLYQHQERIGLLSWMMICGHIKLLLRHQLVPHHSSFYMGNLVTYLLNWNTELIGQPNLWIGTQSLLGTRLYSLCITGSRWWGLARAQVYYNRDTVWA